MKKYPELEKKVFQETKKNQKFDIPLQKQIGGLF